MNMKEKEEMKKEDDTKEEDMKKEDATGGRPRRR